MGHNLISGEMSKLKKKKEEEERAKKLAAGMDKIKGQLRAEEDGKATAEMENKAKRAELDGIMGALDAEKAQSGEIMERINQSEQRLLEATAQHDEFQKKLEEERESMKKQLKEAKEKMEEQKLTLRGKRIEIDVSKKETFETPPPPPTSSSSSSSSPPSMRHTTTKTNEHL